MGLQENNLSAAIVIEMTTLLIVFFLYIYFLFYLHGFPVGHKLHDKNVKPKKPDNIHTNIVEPIKGPNYRGNYIYH